MNKRNWLGAGSLLLAVLLLLGITLLGNLFLPGARLDLTDEQLFTLTPGSRNIVGHLQDDITLNFYFSNRLLKERPAIKSYATRVESLLNEYVNRSGGKLHLRVIDPEPFSPEEDRAVQFGLRGFAAGDGGEKAYFGLAGTNTTDGEQVIPLFHPSKEDTLEYDITRLIYNLDHPDRKVVAILSSLPIDGTLPGMPASARRQPEWMVLTQMKEVFDTRVLDPQKVTAIDQDVDVLMVAHPQRFSEQALYAIDQFVLRGGRLLLFMDPYSDSEPARRDPLMANMPAPKSPSSLGDLLSAWGIAIDSEKFVADKGLARKIRVSRDPASPAVRYLAWLEVPRENLSQEEVITSGLTTLSMATVGAITPLPGASTQIVPLVRSSADATLMPTQDIQFQPDPSLLLDKFKPSGEVYTLAARVTGKVKTAFPDGPPAPGEQSSDAKTAGGQLQESVAPVNLIVVADSDILADRFWVQVQDFLGERLAQVFADNGSFVVNALDNLTGSSDLISVRSRAAYYRPFTRVIAMERDAADRFRATEKQLQGQLEQTEKKLEALQQPGQQTGLVLSPEQRAEIDRFLAEKVRVRKQLRQVRHDLRHDVEQLESRLKLLNIAGVPVILTLLVVLVALARSRRRA